MKKQYWLIALGGALVLTSTLLYLLHYAIFRDAHHIFLYMVGDLAFLPLEVLLVTLIVDTLLNSRERRAAMEKMNMVIGAFFSEVGTGLLRDFCRFDPDLDPKIRLFAGCGAWEERDFQRVKVEMERMTFECDGRAGELAEVRDLLKGERDFLVRLLENPLLLEHETFTDMLWAVFHLAEELEDRDVLVGLPEPDLDHLSGDMSRAYARTVGQWLQYLDHLRRAYPYLFSLAVRLNPFDPEARVTVTS